MSGRKTTSAVASLRSPGRARARVRGPGRAPPRPAVQPAPNVGGIPNVRTAPPPGAPRGGPAAVASPGTHRLPFVLLLCGLLGGALVSALVISTTLAQGSFEISKLQNSTIT